MYIHFIFIFNSYVCAIVFLPPYFVKKIMHGPIEIQFMLNGSFRVEINK